MMMVVVVVQPWCKADARAGSFYFDEVAPLAVMVVMDMMVVMVMVLMDMMMVMVMACRYIPTT